MSKIKIILICIGIAIMTVCCGVFLLSHLNGFGWKVLAIPTGSMRPDIPPGSMVLVHRVPDSKLKVGDVITYANPMKQSETISHRIIKTYSIDRKIPAYITKGDANPSPDQPVVAGQVRGKVVWHVPYVGFPLLYSKDPIVILPIIYLAALLIMIEEVQRLAAYYRRWVYRLPGYGRKVEVDHTVAKRISLGGALTTAFVVIGLAISPAALAALRSNTVVLANNRLSVANQSGGGGQNCQGQNNYNQRQNKNNKTNNINIHTSTTQNAKTGNAHSQGGNATSGNASNCSTTTININISH